MQRYGLLSTAIDSDTILGTHISKVAASCLPFKDLSVLDSYHNYNTRMAIQRVPSVSADRRATILHHTIKEVISFARSTLTNNLRSAIGDLYSALPEMDFPGLRDVQVSHPLSKISPFDHVLTVYPSHHTPYKTRVLFHYSRSLHPNSRSGWHFVMSCT